jgi:hypothetical protein
VLFEAAVVFEVLVAVLLEPLESVSVLVLFNVLFDAAVVFAVFVAVLLEPLESVSVMVFGLELELVSVVELVSVEVLEAVSLLKLVELLVLSAGVAGSAANKSAGVASDKAATDASKSGFIERTPGDVGFRRDEPSLSWSTGRGILVIAHWRLKSSNGRLRSPQIGVDRLDKHLPASP